jgi:SAM-dependent methyltransferase
MMVRRSAVEQAGGIDMALPGGDDLDLSIRLRKAGYELWVDRNVFVYHHGFKTGERVNGNSTVSGGWNSIEMQERTNQALIQKHGLRAYLECMTQIPQKDSHLINWTDVDTEGEEIRKYIIGDKVVEIGCGMKKTVPHAVGVDRIAFGEQVNGVKAGLTSLADVIADAEGNIPLDNGQFDTVIARHILEHVIDSVGAINEWGRILKHGGRMIIAVPDHTMRNTIPMNKEHVRAFTPSSLKSQMESLGWKTVDFIDPKNNVSFIGVFEKNGVQE